MTVVTMIAFTERQKRFQKVFLKKIEEERSHAEQGKAFPRLRHRLGMDVDCSSLKKFSNAGEPLIGFDCPSMKVILTTTGIFCPGIGKKSQGHINWSEMNFVCAPNLVFDDFSMTLEQSTGAISVSIETSLGGWLKIIPVIPTALVLSLFISRANATYDSSGIIGKIFETMAFPIAVLGLLPILYIIFWKLTKYLVDGPIPSLYFSFFPNRYNVIALRPWHSRAHIGAIVGAEDICACIALALQIYRAQAEKYGTQIT